MDSTNDNRILIKVKTLAPAEYELHVPANMEVAELKDRLVEHSGILHERQRLLYMGHVLNDGQRLSDHRVQNGHTLHLVERPPGQNAPVPEAGPQAADQPAGPNNGTFTQDQLNMLIANIVGPLAGMASGMPQNPFSVRIDTGEGATMPGEAAAFGLGGGGVFGTPVQQRAADAHQQAPVAGAPPTALLSTVQQYLNNLAQGTPSTAGLLPSMSYILPEARRVDSERRWYTAAREVLEAADLSNDARRFVNTASISGLASAPRGQSSQGAGAAASGRLDAGAARARPMEAGRQHDTALPSVVAMALGAQLQQLQELLVNHTAPQLRAAADRLSATAGPAPAGEASEAEEALRQAGSTLFSTGAVVWELARLSSMVLPALQGRAQLPLAVGRPAFINAAGTTPSVPFPGPMHAGGHRFMGGMLGGDADSQQQRNSVSVQLPTGRVVTGHFTGEAPSQEDFLQQLSMFMGGQFGIPRPHELQPALQHLRNQQQQQQQQVQQQQRQRTSAARTASAPTGAAATGFATAAAASNGQRQPASEMEGVSDAGESEYESEWEEADEAEAAAMGVDAAETPHAAASSDAAPSATGQGGQQGARPGSADANTQTGQQPAIMLGGGSPSFSIHFTQAGPQQVEVNGVAPMVGMPQWQNAVQAALPNLMALNPAGSGQLPGAVPVADQLGRFVASLITPVLSELMSRPEGRGQSAAEMAETLGNRIVAALQPSLGVIQRLIQQFSQPTAQPGPAGPPQPQDRRSDVAANAPPHQGAAAATGAQPQGQQQPPEEQQWMYVPTTSVTAEITVEQVDETGSMASGSAPTSGQAATGGQQAQPAAGLPVMMPALQAAFGPNAQQVMPVVQQIVGSLMASGGAGPTAQQNRPASASAGPSAATAAAQEGPTNAAAASEAAPYHRDAVSDVLANLLGRQARPTDGGTGLAAAAAPAADAAGGSGAAAGGGGGGGGGTDGGTSSAPAATPAAHSGEAGGPAGLGGTGLQRPPRARAAPSGTGVGLGASGLPPRGPQRLAPQQSTGGRPEGGAGRSTPASGPSPQLGDALAAMLGGGGGGGGLGAMLAGGGGGGLGSMLQQMASSPMVQQLAESPAMQEAMQPLLGGSQGQGSGGQVDFGAMMNQMMPLVSQMLGGGGGLGGTGSSGASGASSEGRSAPAAGAARAQQPVGPSADAGTGDHAATQSMDHAKADVAEDVEAAIRGELPESEAERWLAIMRQDAPHVQDAGDSRPLSETYLAGGLHPPTSSQRMS